MKKIKSVSAAVCAAAVFAFAGCGSAPKKAPEPVIQKKEAPAPVVEPEPEPEPEPVVEVEEPQEPVVEEKESEDDIRNRNQSIFDELELSRKAAIDAGAQSACPEKFAQCENEYNELKKRMANGEDVSDELAALNKKYLALKAFAEAKAKKQRIDSLDFAQYNQKDYDSGCGILGQLEDQNTAFDGSWEKNAKTAGEKFDSVLDAGFRALCKAERDKAFAAKKNADSVKCSVSRKDEYKTALEAFKKGDSVYVTKDPEGALKEYTKAREIFSRLFDEVSAARARAQKAIDDAKARVEQSESVAVQADIEKPLGDEAVDGIEAEDAVLLEEDDFTEVENLATESEEAIDEDIDDQIEGGNPIKYGAEAGLDDAAKVEAE